MRGTLRVRNIFAENAVVTPFRLEKDIVLPAVHWQPTVCCNVLQCGAVRCSVLHCVRLTRFSLPPHRWLWLDILRMRQGTLCIHDTLWSIVAG